MIPIAARANEEAFQEGLVVQWLRLKQAFLEVQIRYESEGTRLSFQPSGQPFPTGHTVEVDITHGVRHNPVVVAKGQRKLDVEE